MAARTDQELIQFALDAAKECLYEAELGGRRERLEEIKSAVEALKTLKSGDPHES